MRHVLGFLAILAVVGLALWYDLDPRFPIREGLDLKGGMRVILEADKAKIRQDKMNVTVDAKTMAQVREIMEQRVNNFGLSGATVQVKGEDQIVATLPGARNPEQALEQLQKVAQLSFRWLKDVQTKNAPNRRYRMSNIPGDPSRGIADQTTFTDSATGQAVPEAQVVAESPLILTGSDMLPRNSQGISPGGGRAEPVVNFEFNAHGASVFANFTSKNVGEHLGIVLDNHVISAPVIEEPITEGKGVIRGGFATLVEARNLASLLNSGALPVPMKVAETQTVGATLGMEAIRKSVLAGIGGLVLVLLFMIGYYALPGVLACIALIFYAALTFAIFKLFGIVLDLPGITGFILSVGMAVDANILIFERMREEMRAGKTLHAAIDAGFNRALTSIIDSNVTTWIVCAVLFWLGAPIIKGFAMTLFLGVAVSMFTAITVTRTMLHLVVNFPFARSEKAFGLNISWLSNRMVREGRVLDVIGKRRVYFGLSLGMLALGLIFLGMGGLRPGIDFTGGSQLQLVYNQPVTSEQVQGVLQKAGVDDALVTVGSANLVRTTVNLTSTGEVSESALPDLKARLGEIRGFDESAYKESVEPTKRTVTATAVYVTNQPVVTKDAVLDALRADVKVGTAPDLRTLAKMPLFNVTTAEEKRSGLPIVFITSREMSSAKAKEVGPQLQQLGGGTIQAASQTQTIGPSIASEVTLNAFTSMLVASLLIIVYLTFRFAIGGFMNGLKFGVCAVIALIHDVVTVTGFFALMGKLRGWHVDSLYVTAALTIIGFSVHDTIVVYDRIRENLRNRLRGESFADVANRSITQTFDRSINTSMTVVLTLLAMYLFGGESTALFNIALLMGIVIGTYSSIFVASPLVVLWEGMANRGAAAGAKRDDVRLRPAPASGPSGGGPRPSAPRPRPEATTNGDGSDVPVGAGRGAAPRPSSGGGSSTIKPKRKRRT